MISASAVLTASPHPGAIGASSELRRHRTANLAMPPAASPAVAVSAELASGGDGIQHRRNARGSIDTGGPGERRRRDDAGRSTTALRSDTSSYPGGKAGSGVYQRIISLMPPHDAYIEPFLGGAAIMLRKLPAARNIGFDLDPFVLCVAAGKLKDGDGRPTFRLRVGDGLAFLARCRPQPSTLIYCDPPYLMATRSSPRRLYPHEMDEAGHRRLLDVIKRMPCMVMISGYWSDLYGAALAGWNSISYSAMTRGGKPATEHLWFNFAPPLVLHDYRYLGRDFRERERIKRKKLRWVERLRRMPVMERQALLAAMNELASSGVGGDATRLCSEEAPAA